MKVFAILTACAMVAAGATYGLYSYTACESSCASRCEMSTPEVATIGSCCAQHDSPAASTEPSCCTKAPANCPISEACCLGAEKVLATVKPVEIEGCCEVCASPTRVVISAATAVAAPK